MHDSGKCVCMEYSSYDVMWQTLVDRSQDKPIDKKAPCPGVCSLCGKNMMLLGKDCSVNINRCGLVKSSAWHFMQAIILMVNWLNAGKRDEAENHLYVVFSILAAVDRLFSSLCHWFTSLFDFIIYFFILLFVLLLFLCF